MSVTFRQAGAGDVPALNAALARLSADIGDTHRASDEDLRRAGFGAHPAFRAVLAETAEGLVGVALYSPAMSTSKGLVVTYVADLWISPDLRGQRLRRDPPWDVESSCCSAWFSLISAASAKLLFSSLRRVVVTCVPPKRVL